MYCSSFLAGYGPGFVYATEYGVTRVEIPDVSRRDTVSPNVYCELKPSELSITTAVMLQSYFDGADIDFSDIPVVLDGITPFRKKVLEIIRRIPFGKICSYGQIANVCGVPHAARAVGGALAANPIPVVIPCHRVVAANGCLTGFSAPGGKNSKLAMLAMEGIEFKGMRVVTNQMVMHSIPNR